jgi:ATP-dependent metalloprotease FtsH
LLSAVGQHAKARTLLAQCLNLSIQDLRDQYIDIDHSQTLFAGVLEVSKPVHRVLEDAKDLAYQEPDRKHPGLIAVKHLVCSLAKSEEACVLLGVSPLDKKAALNVLNSWYEGVKALPLLGNLTERMRVLRAELLNRIFGQNQAVNAFVEGVFNAEVVAKVDEQRVAPKTVFLFAGPPGVGKTYLAELSASYLGRTYKRFDMSEFSDHQQHMQLVGFPPSFKSAQKGTLTGFVQEYPESILLFDEIEKAHQNTIHLFLQILDAGRLEDKYTAQTISFRDTIIIFTTNAGRALYDHPNRSGVNVGNQSFHRKTIIDAIRTEEDDHGRPFFPASLCSRISMGYPILFNYLGINELEKISRMALRKTADLIERQYYMSLSFDDKLPLLLVLREGSKADARTVKSQSALFIKNEIFKFSDLYKKGRLKSVLRQIDVINFVLDTNLKLVSEIDGVLQEDHTPSVLLVAAEGVLNMFKDHISEIKLLTANSAEDATQILMESDVDFVLLDMWVGRSVKSMGSGSVIGTVDQFDFTPLGAQELSEGQKCLINIHERLPDVPVYLLSFAGEEEGYESVDEHLFLACVRSGGARGIISTQFVNDVKEGWKKNRDQLVRKIRKTSLATYRQEQARKLSREHKILSFDTLPRINQLTRRVDVRLRNLRLSRAVSAEDTNELLDDVSRPTVNFDDVFGAQNAKEALQFVKDWLKNPRHYAALGIRPPKGILLTGPPGTGKTLLARALAGESDAAFIVASGTDFVTIWQGSGPQNIRNLFDRARRYAPSIIFIDEIDAIGKERGSVGGAGRAEENTLNALLTEMDGFDSPTVRPSIVIGATNLAEHLDGALLRRFDRAIEVPPPDFEARRAYLRAVLLNRKNAKVTEHLIEVLAKRSARMTIAQLERIVNEAAIMAAREEKSLSNQIVEEAYEKIRMGEIEEVPDEQTLLRIARHEAGHAVVGWLFGNYPMQVTIVGRGGAGGYVEREIDEEKIIFTRTELEEMICQSMGGRAAETIYYGETDGFSTGVSSDLKHATQWAERMISQFGMSDEIGQVFFDARYLKDGPMAAKINGAAEEIVHNQLDQAVKLLEENREKLDLLSEVLVEKNRLDRSQLEMIFDD